MAQNQVLIGATALLLTGCSAPTNASARPAGIKIAQELTVPVVQVSVPAPAEAAALSFVTQVQPDRSP